MKKKLSLGSIRKRPLSLLVILMILCMVAGGAIYASSMQSMGRAARGSLDTAYVTDPSTMGSWTASLENNTKYIGRIWTDKSVLAGDSTLSPSGITVPKGDSDFLIALSALSSTSNIRSVSGGVPLDIVMVLDTSGSMDYGFGDGEYVPTYDTTAGGLFNDPGDRYVLVNGEYRQLDRRGWGRNYYWELDGQRIEFKESESDSTPGRYQMYMVVKPSRMSGLQTAAKNFIDATAEVNEGITEASDKHRISIVTFAANSSIEDELTVCQGTDSTALKDTIDGLDANGATRADYGMEQAQTALNSSRENAKKVVVFFTDGVPTSGNNFEGSVANGAIETAKVLKDDGALIYTIGIFDGADPDGTDNSNSYMNAMSGNYPDATAYNSLGSRVSDDAAYYKVAANAAELDNIFQEISEEIINEAGYPTEIQNPSGNPADATRDGYITFIDRLGAYMQVDDFKAIVFSNHKFELPAGGKTTAGNTDTYVFEGTAGSSLYPAGNLNSIIITVEKGGFQEGDLVTVKIPAALIPLRDFDVDTEDPNNITTNVAEAMPIRVFYGVSLKDGVMEKIAEPDSGLASYIRENTSNGKVHFYSNAFTKGAQPGDTVAAFTPAASNSFYHFTEDTYLYSDENCTTPVTSMPQGAEYYFKKTYYENSVNTAQTIGASIKGRQILDHARAGEGGQYYIPAGTARISQEANFYAQKNPNNTETAAASIYPQWDSDDATLASQVLVHLGNNGRLDVELPGTLEVTKTVEVAEGFDKAKFENTDFTFRLDLKGDTGEYTAKKFDGAQQQGEAFTIKDGDTFTLKDGWNIKIYGLSNGTQYEVTEENLPGGFSQTAVTEQNPIAGGETTTVGFTNTYSAGVPESIDTSRFFAGAKVMSGRDWKAGETYTFVREEAGTAPAAAKIETKITATADGTYKDGEAVPFDFGEVEFTKPGEYTYVIYESEPGTQRPGVSYSQALYTVTVTVEDNGDGTMSARSSMVQTYNDSNVATGTATDIALITNRYSARSVDAGPNGNKNYQDLSGGDMPLSKCNFRFKVTPLTEGSPEPIGITTEADGSFTVTNEGSSISYGRATFTDQHGKPYYDYLLEEVMPNGATAANDYTYKGMKYDPAKYIARFTPTVQGLGDDAEITVAVTYWNTDNGVDPTTQLAGNRVYFNNSYEPAPAQLSGDDVIHGEKTIKGRDMKSGEAFDFELTAGDPKTAAAIADGEIVIAQWIEAEGMAKAQVTDAKKDVAEAFSFGDISFSKIGEYKFNITETAGNAGGVTYDGHTAQVTVTVHGEEGYLQAEAVYDNGTGKATDKAVFENVYSSTLNYGALGGITVNKTLSGRAMAANEFSFSIAAVDGAPIGAGDKSFSSRAAADGVAVSMPKLLGLAFTEADAGKTYAYIVDETGDEQDKNGVKYDKSQYRVEIAVSDPEQIGNLKAETTITRIIKADGTADNTPIGTYVSGSGTQPAISFNNSYKASPKTLDTGTLFTKTLRNRQWLSTDQFDFVMTADPGTPVPADMTAEVKNSDPAKASVNFGFGDIEYTGAGVYVYKVTETPGSIPGITYSANEATLTVTVTDNGDGTLSVSPRVTSGVFINLYGASIDYAAAGGLDITKTLNGKDMEADQFEFILRATDRESREKLGMTEESVAFGSVAADDGEKVVILPLGDMFDFDINDKNNTYTYEISETDGGQNGYTYDTEARTVSIKVEDNLDGNLKITTTVSGKGDDKEYVYVAGQVAQQKATVDFVNSYSASTGADGGDALKAGKVLNGRPLKAGEFNFDVKTKDATPVIVMTGVNDEKGAVTFNKKFEYTAASLDQAVKDGYATKGEAGGGYVWTVNYTVAEDTTGFDKLGLTGTAASYDFTVTVTDNGDGTLTAAVNYPQGEQQFTFVNTYSTGAAIPVNLTGSKVLKAEAGLNAPDIAGKYTFKLTGEDNAPTPAKTTADNDQNGNVNFGTVEFDLSMLDGVTAAADGSRSKEFKYTVSEEGKVDGVINDGDKSFVITLKDNGKGLLTATADKEQGPLFTFTNEYKVTAKTYSITEDIEVNKVLKDGDLSKFKFKFELTEGDKVVATGESDVDGKVVFKGIEYNKPGTHNYIVREVNDHAEGVIYDPAIYNIVTEVTDNGDGTLTAKSSLRDSADTEITFENTYEFTGEVSVTIGASKVLKGAELAKGQFTFELLDESGRVAATATNDENGVIVFDKLTYDKEGVFNYKVREVNDGQKDVTYDSKVYDVAVKVVKGDSALEAEVTGDAMVFTNTCEMPQAGGAAPKTGDDNSGIMWMLIAAACAAGAAGAYRRRQSYEKRNY